MCPLKKKAPNWRVSVVWADSATENAENALFGCEKNKKKMLRVAKIQLVWYPMWDPNICLQGAVFLFFFSFSPSPLSHKDGEPW